MGLSIDILKASTSREIDEVFATMVREHVGALLIADDSYFASRIVQLATLGARHGIATSSNDRLFVQVGGLMSYGPDLVEVDRQLGVYTGQILKGAMPADLPVVQSTKFWFFINAQTARALGIEPWRKPTRLSKDGGSSLRVSARRPGRPWRGRSSGHCR